MSRWKRLVVVGLTLTVIGSVGAASASKVDNDRDIAEHALLRVEDLPGGYHKGPAVKVTAPLNTLGCRAYLPEYRKELREAAIARSHRFFKIRHATIKTTASDAVYVWPTEAGAAEHLSAYANTIPDCVHDGIVRGLERSYKDAGKRYDRLDVTVDRVPNPPLGDDGVAYAATSVIHRGTKTVTRYIYADFVRVNRALAFIALTQARVDPPQEAEIANKAVHRLSRALGVPTTLPTT